MPTRATVTVSGVSSYDGIFVTSGAAFNAVLTGAPLDLVGTLGYAIIDLDAVEVVPRTTDGIIELGGGAYRAAVPASPIDLGDYLIRWDTGEATPQYAYEELTVNSTGEPPGPPTSTENDAIATLADLRDLEPLDDDARYPDELVLATRDAVIESLEKACSVSFVQRERVETFADDVPMSKLNLERTRGIIVTECTIDGGAVNAGDVAAMKVRKGGLLVRGGASRRSRGFGYDAEVTYLEGYEQCPGRVSRAVKMLTRDWLVEHLDSAMPSRATSWTAGEDTYRLVTAGVAGALFDLPEANAVVKQYRE